MHEALMHKVEIKALGDVLNHNELPQVREASCGRPDPAKKINNNDTRMIRRMIVNAEGGFNDLESNIKQLRSTILG